MIFFASFVASMLFPFHVPQILKFDLLTLSGPQKGHRQFPCVPPALESLSTLGFRRLFPVWNPSLVSRVTLVLTAGAVLRLPAAGAALAAAWAGVPPRVSHA